MPKGAIFLIAATAFLSAAVLPCWANLGDTLSQSIARYGKPITQGKGDSSDAGYPWYVFRNGNFEIQEYFSGKTCWMEDWCKKDRTAMSKSEQSAILNANKGRDKWSEPKEESGARSWLRSDGATALYDPIRGTMTAGNDILLTLIPARKK